MKRGRNWLLFMTVVMIWSFNWAIMKVALNRVEPLSFVLQVLLLSAATLSPILIFARKRIHADMKTILKLVLLGVINALMMLMTLLGLVHEASGVGAVLNYAQPLFVFFLSILFLKGEAKVGRLLGALMGFSGVVVLSIGGSLLADSYACFLVAGAFLWAVMILFYKKLLGNVSPVLTCVMQQSVGAACLLPLAIAWDLRSFSFPFEPDYVVMILYSSVLAYGVAAVLWIRLIGEEDVTVLSSSSYLVPATAVILGWFFLGETPGASSILGMSLILLGVYLVQRTHASDAT